MGFLHRASRCDLRESRHQPLCRGSRRSRFEGIELVDNGAWISTAYLIDEIIVIPLTDYLSRVFSFRIYAHVLAATGLQFGQMQCLAAGKLSRVQSDRIRCQFARLRDRLQNCSHTKAVSKPTRCSS
jgi:hypothetical protein